MTRHAIAVEGQASFPGVFLERNCLRMPEGAERLNVMLSDPLEFPIGYATDFQRDEETGEISMDFHLSEEWAKLKKPVFSIGAKIEFESTIGDMRHINEAVVQYLILIGVSQ